MLKHDGEPTSPELMVNDLATSVLVQLVPL